MVIMASVLQLPLTSPLHYLYNNMLTSDAQCYENGILVLMTIMTSGSGILYLVVRRRSCMLILLLYGEHLFFPSYYC